MNSSGKSVKITRFRSSNSFSKMRNEKRTGTATVEMALCLPVLILLVFGGIEAAHFIQLKQDLTICAYEAAKKATRNGASMEEAIDRFDEIAAAKGISNASISFSPTFDTTTASGTEITVLVTAPAESNYDMPVDYYLNRNLSAEVTMVRQQY